MYYTHDKDGKQHSWSIKREGATLKGHRRVIVTDPASLGANPIRTRANIEEHLRRSRNDVAFYTDALRHFDREVEESEAARINAELTAKASADAQKVSKFLQTVGEAMKTATRVMNSETISPELVAEADRQCAALAEAMDTVLTIEEPR
jgi:hypothetical protein